MSRFSILSLSSLSEYVLQFTFDAFSPESFPAHSSLDRIDLPPAGSAISRIWPYVEDTVTLECEIPKARFVGVCRQGTRHPEGQVTCTAKLDRHRQRVNDL